MRNRAELSRFNGGMKSDNSKNNGKTTASNNAIVLTDDAKIALAQFFDVLISMDSDEYGNSRTYAKRKEVSYAD